MTRATRSLTTSLSCLLAAAVFSVQVLAGTIHIGHSVKATDNLHYGGWEHALSASGLHRAQLRRDGAKSYFRISVRSNFANGLEFITVRGRAVDSVRWAFGNGVFENGSLADVPVLQPFGGVFYSFASSDGYFRQKSDAYDVSVSTVPLPGNGLLLGTGLFALALKGRRRRHVSKET